MSELLENLENAGYKGNRQFNLRDILPDQSSVVIANFNVDNVRQEVVFQINLHIPTQKVNIPTNDSEKN